MKVTHYSYSFLRIHSLIHLLGNVHLRDGEVDQAIDCYNRALELGDNEQEGVLLVMRGTALLQRAYAYKMRFKDMITIAEDILPNEKRLDLLLFTYSLIHLLTHSLTHSFTLDCKVCWTRITHSLPLYVTKYLWNYSVR